MRSHRTVHHFGPDPAYVGGMGSVINVLATYSMGCEQAEVHPTWRPNSKLASVPLALGAALSIPFVRSSDIVHIHVAEDGAFIREGMLVLLARLLNKITVVTIHGANFLPFSHKHRRLAASVLKCAHLITCLDLEVLSRVRQIVPDTHAEMMANPVSMDDASPTADETDEVVLFAGEIGLRKGADVLWRAWQLVTTSRPQARCIMVGPVNDFTAPPAPRLDVKRSVDAETMKGLIRSARVVALPSRAEGMPMILTEAMGGGRPFVSTPVGGIPELAARGGVLVDVEDEVALAQSLTSLLADRALARRIGEQGRQYCRETRSVDVIDHRLTALYSAAATRA